MSDLVSALLNDMARTAAQPAFEHGFGQAGARVILRADHPEVLRSAIDTLYAYHQRPATSGGWQITLHTSATLNVDLAATAFTGAPIHNIGPDLTAHSLTWPHGRLFWVPAHATFLHVQETAARITVYCADRSAGVHWAARLVRQVMTAQLLAGGAVYAHGAAFIHQGIGVLVLGHKGAGKTTTLLTALGVLGADFVTNDRLLLRHHGTDITGLAWPMHLRVSAETLLALPGRADLVPEVQHAGPADGGQIRKKIAIEPPDLGRLLAGGIVTGTVRPDLVLCPYLSQADEPAERVPAEQMRTMLLSTRLYMHDPGTGASAHINHWLVTGSTPDRTTAALREVVYGLASVAPCYRLPVILDPAKLATRLAHLLARWPSSATTTTQPAGPQ
ncbi:MAG: hypothetical protein HYR62_02925 [Actinobacteria bacterium]|nr:hypothetical protein [Actinomycetota bacterium]MBI3687423.1 hypothetical protein [Actinomycetota bacterium]